MDDIPRFLYNLKNSARIAVMASLCRDSRMASQESLQAIRTRSVRLGTIKKLPKKEIREKCCIKWLLMLYYEGSRLKGDWLPFGIETDRDAIGLCLLYSLKGDWLPFGIETLCSD